WPPGPQPPGPQPWARAAPVAARAAPSTQPAIQNGFIRDSPVGTGWGSGRLGTEYAVPRAEYAVLGTRDCVLGTLRSTSVAVPVRADEVKQLAAAVGGHAVDVVHDRAAVVVVAAALQAAQQVELQVARLEVVRPGVGRRLVGLQRVD